MKEKHIYHKYKNIYIIIIYILKKYTCQKK